MQQRNNRRTLRLLTATVAATAIVFAGCGSSDDGTSGDSTSQANGSTTTGNESDSGGAESTSASTGDGGSSGGVAVPTDEDIELVFWDHVQSSKDIDDAYRKAADDFTAMYPNVTIKIETFPFEQYQDKLLTAVAGGSGPDIMSLDQPWMPQFAESGFVASLDDYISQSDAVTADAFFPAAWDTTIWKGQQWAVPLGFDVWEMLMWNPELFEAAGLDPMTPPKTWDELLTFAEKLTDEGTGQYGIVLPSAKSEVIPVFNNSFVYSNGGAIIQEDGTVVMDSPENATTYTYLYNELIKFAPNGMAGMDHGAAEALFTSGKVAMLFDGNWAEDTMNAQAKFDWQAAVPPVPKEGDTFHGATGGWNLAVSSKTDHPEAAYAFIEYMTSTPEVQIAVAANTPALKEAATSYLATRKFPDVLEEISQNGMARPKSPIYPEISDIQQDGVQSILGGADVASTLSDMQAKMEKALADL